MNEIETYKILKEYYIDKKLKIFPVAKDGKIPLIGEWQNDCSYSALQIMYWLKNAPQCNWALPCTPNDIFVLDIDTHGVNGLESAKRLFDDLGIKEIDTLSQQTPSGGLHLIFKSDKDLKGVANTSNSFKDYKGIDIRTLGYIVTYPSSVKGKKYLYNSDKKINPMPQKLKEFILSQKELVKENKKERSEYIKPKVVEEGNRDTALFEYITFLYYHTKLSKDEIRVLASDFNENVCNPPLNDRTVRYKVNKAFKKERNKCIYIWLGKKEE